MNNFCKTVLCKLNFSGMRLIRNFCSSKVQPSVMKIADQIVSYVRVGQGERSLICLPGALGTIWSDFKPQVNQLDRDKFTIVAFDPPGYGQSRPPNRKFTTEFYKNDAETAHKLMSKLGFNKYSVLGWSDGGISGIILAAHYPDYIDKLIVWGANSYVTSEDIRHFEQIRDIKKWSQRAREPMINMYGEKEFQELWNGWCDVQGEFLKKGGNVCMEYVSKIKCQTLIVHGAQDPMVGPEHPNYLNANIRTSSMYIFPEGKHNIHLKYANEFNKVVTDFITDKYIE